MNESEQAQAIQCDEHWSLGQIIADGKEDDEFWESPEFDLFAVDSVRFYTQKRALIKYVDTQAQKIAELSALFQKAGNGAADLAMKCSEQEMTIAKLTAEIEKLKTNYSAVIATNRQRG